MDCVWPLHKCLREKALPYRLHSCSVVTWTRNWAGLQKYSWLKNGKYIHWNALKASVMLTKKIIVFVCLFLSPCNRACAIPSWDASGTFQTLSIGWQLHVLYLHSHHQYQYTPIQQPYIQHISTFNPFPQDRGGSEVSLPWDLWTQLALITPSGVSFPSFFYPSGDGLIQPDQPISFYIPNQPSPREQTDAYVIRVSGTPC